MCVGGEKLHFAHDIYVFIDTLVVLNAHRPAAVTVRECLDANICRSGSRKPGVCESIAVVHSNCVVENICHYPHVKCGSKA